MVGYVMYRDGLSVSRQSPIQVIIEPDVQQIYVDRQIETNVLITEPRRRGLNNKKLSYRREAARQLSWLIDRAIH